MNQHHFLLNASFHVACIIPCPPFYIQCIISCPMHHWSFHVPCIITCTILYSVHHSMFHSCALHWPKLIIMFSSMPHAIFHVPCHSPHASCHVSLFSLGTGIRLLSECYECDLLSRPSPPAPAVLAADCLDSRRTAVLSPNPEAHIFKCPYMARIISCGLWR